MIGPCQRHERDMDGAGIDAARRLLEVARVEERALVELRRRHRNTEGATWTMEQLIFGVLIAWVDEHIDSGVYTEAQINRDLERITKAVSRLEALRALRSPS